MMDYFVNRLVIWSHQIIKQMLIYRITAIAFLDSITAYNGMMICKKECIIHTAFQFLK